MITAEEKVFTIQDLRYIILSFYLDKIKKKKIIRKKLFKKIKEKISNKIDNCLFFIIFKIYNKIYLS